MSKPVLVVTTHFVHEVEIRIDRDFEVRRKPNGTVFSQDELLSAADGADAMLITPFDRLDATFFERVSSSVKVIATYSVGYDQIDLDAAAKRNIGIAHTPGAVTEATADIAILLMLGASRRAYEAQELVLSGEWKSPAATLLGWQMGGKILGIFGMGRIGQAVAKRARGFGMKIHYFNPYRLPSEIEEDAVFHDDPYDLLRVSAFLSLHAAETKETHHFLDANALACLPHGAIVVNTARGGMVVDEDLIAALKSGQVAAAGLDTFEGEPSLNPGYLPLKNIFLLPHIGSATVETRTAMGLLALDNIDAVLKGTPAPSLVTSDRLQARTDH
jgi:lactate dehydrogenase-like 2-hydroxyacid dehydrogenase